MPAWTPLHEAARIGDHDAIRRLVAEGVDLEATIDVNTDRGAYPHLVTALMVAAGSSDGATAETVRPLLDAGASIAPGASGTSPLTYAASSPRWSLIGNGDAARLKVLLDAGSEPNVPERNLVTPLGRAARAGDPERVRMLLDAGADLEPDNPRWSFQMPLNCTAESGSAECVELLLAAGADPNRGPEPALASATSPAAVASLLAAGADPNAPTGFGTFVVNAIAQDHEELSRETRTEMLTLLRDAGGDLDIRDEHGYTPLFRIAFNDIDGYDPIAVEAILVAGADPFAGRSAIGAVCWYSSYEVNPNVDRIVELLVAAGLDVNDQDDAGFRPIHCAVSPDWHGTGYRSSDGLSVAAVHALVLHGADIDVPFPDDGLKPLHCAVRQGSAAAVEILLGAGADAHEPAPDGRLPVDMARAAVSAGERSLATARDDMRDYYQRGLDNARACLALF